MTFSSRVVAAVAWGVIAAATAIYAPGRAADDTGVPPPPPLTNEDIVRMVASGAEESETIATIRARTESFDLSDEMVDELRLAGVSAAIVTAMKRRHAELAPPPAPAERPSRGRTPVVVTLNAGGAGSRTLHAPAWANEDAKAQLHLPKETDQREVKDLAVFLACTSSEHVPDLWRSKSPLGRDMNFVVRHEMLAFVAGDTPAGKPPRLALPASLKAEVEDGVAHDLVLGVAARIGDRWIQLGTARLPKVTIGPGQKALVGRIDHRGRGFDFNVELSAPR